MMFPVRCFTCGAPLAQHWDEFKEAKLKGENLEEWFNKKGIKRICCRRMFLSQPLFEGGKELIDEIMPYGKM